MHHVIIGAMIGVGASRPIDRVNKVLNTYSYLRATGAIFSAGQSVSLILFYQQILCAILYDFHNK